MTTAISLLLRLCKPGQPAAVVPSWLWDQAQEDFFLAPPSEELRAAFITILYAAPVRAPEAA